ncbi:MAG: glycosyltransferase family 2 protein [Ardenticatenaceae bacterium]|nr:glycosyltransferase family 2 protein [Anaerolineales bacterium]MCB8941376.1 glycosyltransferase family 2 protein [Ardenticatenaceae bacterium]MCB8972732.1 glycosyltransferase family 2 protein [Ardenticatenaceae bacterium]
MTQPDLSIIIVSWNVQELLSNCLRSVLGQSERALQIIVVDSASSDGSAAMVAEEFPEVELIACQENVGFPRGNNLGLAQANGRYLLLLNPDTIVHDDALAKMVAYLEENPQVGVVGPQLLNEDGTVQSSRRRFPSLKTALFESTWLQPYAPQSVLDDYYVRDVGDEETAVVHWVMGACLMTRQEVVAQVGGLDEDYFMYSEELDYCRRIHGMGWQVVYYPPAKVTHLSGKSSEQAVTHRHINFNRAKLRYFRKNHGRFAAGMLRLFLLVSYAWQMFVEAIKGAVGHKRPLRWQRVKAYWMVLRSGLRPAGY